MYLGVVLKRFNKKRKEKRMDMLRGEAAAFSHICSESHVLAKRAKISKRQSETCFGKPIEKKPAWSHVPVKSATVVDSSHDVKGKRAHKCMRHAQSRAHTHALSAGVPQSHPRITDERK